MNYMFTLHENFPNVQARCTGDERVYANIAWISGDILPSDAVLQASYLGVIQDKVWELIKDNRDNRKAGGVLVTSVNKWFHSDDSSRIQQIGLVMFGADIPTDLQWKTMDGTFITMTPVLARQTFQSVASSDQIIFALAERHRIAMMACVDPTLYDFTTGWPAIYEDVITN